MGDAKFFLIYKKFCSNLSSIPAHLRQGVEAELFAHRYSRVSLAGNKEFDAAWREYLELDAQTERDTRMRSFLLQLFKRAVRKRKYCFADHYGEN